MMSAVLTDGEGGWRDSLIWSAGAQLPLSLSRDPDQPSISGSPAAASTHQTHVGPQVRGVNLGLGFSLLTAARKLSSNHADAKPNRNARR